jgi:hypothetical protein
VRCTTGRACAAAPVAGGCGDAGEERLHRQRSSDHARREHEDFFRLQLEQRGRAARGRQRVSLAPRARGGVCVAGIDNDRLRLRELEVTL